MAPGTGKEKEAIGLKIQPGGPPQKLKLRRSGSGSQIAKTRIGDDDLRPRRGLTPAKTIGKKKALILTHAPAAKETYKPSI